MSRNFVVTDPSGQTGLGLTFSADSVNIMWEDEGARVEFREGSGVIQKFWVPIDVCWRIYADDGEPI